MSLYVYRRVDDLVPPVWDYEPATPAEIRAAAEAAGFLVVDREDARKIRVGQNAVGQDITMPPLANIKSGDYWLVPVDVEEAP